MRQAIRKNLWRLGALYLITLSLGLGVTSVALAGHALTFTSIDVPGAIFTLDSGINPEADIVGQYRNADGTTHGFLLVDGTFVSIDFPGAVFTTALGINPEGDIAGQYTSADGKTHGFLLRKSHFTTIDFPGALFTTALGINARSDIVGRYTAADGTNHGYVLSEEDEEDDED